MKPTLVVSAGVVEDGRVLIVQEGKEHCRGMWGLPGGRVEPGERLILHSDGITARRTRDGLFGLDAIERAVRAAAECKHERLLAHEAGQ